MRTRGREREKGEREGRGRREKEGGGEWSNNFFSSVVHSPIRLTVKQNRAFLLS